LTITNLNRYRQRANGEEMQLQEWLDTNNVTRAAFGKLIGVSERTVYFWIRGEKMPVAKHIYAIREVTKKAVLLGDWVKKRGSTKA
jgi:hypothetical protein